MPTACVRIRTVPVFRFAAFSDGLARVGYQIVPRPLERPAPGDVLVIWNRRASDQRDAKRYEAAGASVIVAENAYLGPPRPKHFALALSHHNGAGAWRIGPEGRWGGYGIELQPWRQDGDHILVLPQRGIGEGGVAMPPGWTGAALASLASRTKRPVRLRRHPGKESVEPYDDLRGAWAAVTWGSGAGIKALAAGVPVFHSLDAWIGAKAALRFESADLERPKMDDEARRAIFERLAWAQWSLDEVQSGEAFAWLMRL